MKTRHLFFCKCIWILPCLFLAIGCASSTKPNTTYSGSWPAAFHNVAARNPLLAQELGKIPEIQNGISEMDAMALERISVFYNQDQKNFDFAVERMFEVGDPNVRKFCTPLQALYWLALDDKLNQIDFSDYSLTRLLNEAWYKTGFEYDGRGRWDDFGEVTERLNSPKLIDYYEIRNFGYKNIRLRKLEDYKNPRNIFRKKQGECWLYTAFSVYCLKKAGYQAYAITVFHGSAPRPNHVTCAYIDKDGEEYILDNSISAYTHSSGIFKKAAYLGFNPYYGKGYLSE